MFGYGNDRRSDVMQFQFYCGIETHKEQRADDKEQRADDSCSEFYYGMDENLRTSQHTPETLCQHRVESEKLSNAKSKIDGYSSDTNHMQSCSAYDDASAVEKESMQKLDDSENYTQCSRVSHAPSIRHQLFSTKSRPNIGKLDPELLSTFQVDDKSYSEKRDMSAKGEVVIFEDDKKVLSTEVDIVFKGLSDEEAAAVADFNFLNDIDVD